jgi:hypothetical protein
MFTSTTDPDTMRDLLSQHVINIAFVKKCGTVRHMRCTTRGDLLPESSTAQSTTKGLAVPAWDLELGEWRSFRTDRVIDWSIAGE